MSSNRGILKPLLVFFNILENSERTEGSRCKIGHFEYEAILIDFIGLFLSKVLLN